MRPLLYDASGEIVSMLDEEKGRIHRRSEYNSPLATFETVMEDPERQALVDAQLLANLSDVGDPRAAENNPFGVQLRIMLDGFRRRPVL